MKAPGTQQAKPKSKTVGPFIKPENITRAYERSLRKVAREVGRIIEGYQAGTGIAIMGALTSDLEKYAKLLRPWAEFKGRELAEATDRQDRAAWAAAAKEMSAGINAEIRNAPVGRTFIDIMQRQVHLITSLPVEAGQRVHKLVIEGLSDSTRADAIAAEIARSGEVTQARAMTIARTETTRAATAFTQARSLAVGAESYIWRSVHDGRVRPLHRELDGTPHRWDSPPVAGENGERAHPGAIYNCRCRPEPIITDR